MIMSEKVIVELIAILLFLAIGILSVLELRKQGKGGKLK